MTKISAIGVTETDLGNLAFIEGERGDGSSVKVPKTLAFPTPKTNRAYTDTLVNPSSTLVIPFDATIPQVTEGTEVLSLSITPSSTTARIRVEARIKCASAGGANWMGAGLFINGGANCVEFSTFYFETNGGGGMVVLSYEYVPGVVTPQTLSVRIGNGIASRTLTMNAPGGTFGGVQKSTLSAWEM